ncbi:TonB-dependent receptor [Methylacidiphilum caldifontis]|uniref:TonB-dependent receptor n=1 Tax=Methylacidiphilum caldifontis TaxID=2795386 RepID=UPI001F5C93A4|nr:TonB-dependent receptor [Methylacidiphilum caldifontis]
MIKTKRFYYWILFILPSLYWVGTFSLAEDNTEESLPETTLKVKGKIPIEKDEQSSFLLSPVKQFGPIDVLDSPRSVFIIDKSLIQATGMGLQPFLDPLSMTFLVPSAYSSVNYGLGIAPFSRGYPSTPYINGIEMNVQNGAFQGIPMNWNMIDSFDFIEGPAQAVFGATQTSSGVTNYLTKQPYFDSFRSSTQFTLGMYEKYLWLVDLGGPIRPNLAYRLSYQGIENGNYYQYVHNDQQNVYFSLGFHPSETYRADFMADLGTYDYTPLFMWMNRPTEALITTGLYPTGSLPSSLINIGTVNNPPFSLYAGQLEPISRRILLQNPEGGGRAVLGMLQFVQKITVSDQLTFLDNTLLWYNRENLLQPPVYYCLSSAGDYEIGHRTECLLDLYFSQNNFPLTLHDLVDSGIEWHIQRNLDYVASSFFGSNAWDMVLSQPIS